VNYYTTKIPDYLRSCANTSIYTSAPPSTTTMSSAARYRKPGTSSPPSNPVGEQEKAELKAAVQQQAAATSSRLSVLDVLRMIGGLLLLSSGLSKRREHDMGLQRLVDTRSRVERHNCTFPQPHHEYHLPSPKTHISLEIRSSPHRRRAHRIRRLRSHQTNLHCAQRHNL
jgi:hypothetical protein